MIDEIVIIGRPGLVGGADTELFDQIKVWLKMGLKCIIIPTSEARYPINYSHPNLVIEDICRYEACSGKHIISFCNQFFLRDIEIIRKYAKTISWASCMCFNFDKEIEAHKQGLIDFFLYQTRHQYHKCGVRLMEANNNYTAIPIIPYFDSTNFPFVENRPEIRYGRISRAGIDKFGGDQFKIYHYSNLKDIKGLVLGWSTELEEYFNNEDQLYLKRNNLVEFLDQGSITAQEFYKQCGIICMTTNTFENLPRIGFEAMASGSLLIVDNRGGWQDLIIDGVTGFLCNDTSDFLKHLEEMVYRPDIRYQIVKNARQNLEAKYSYGASASRWEQFFKLLT